MNTSVDNRIKKAVYFERGTRFLKLRRQRSGRRPDELVRVSREPIAKQIEAELTYKYGISVDEMRAAVKFAHAVHTLIASCGRNARKILLECRFDPKTIEQLARTAPTRQQYGLGQVAKGTHPMAKPKSGVPVLDTEQFSEVTGRLARARGLVQASLARVRALSPSLKTEVAECNQYIGELDETIRASNALGLLVGEYGVVPRKVDRFATPEASHIRPDTLRNACRGNASALGLIAKNNRDIPRLPKKVKPTPEDVCNIKRELKAIIKAAREEHRLLKAIAKDIR